MKKKAFIIKAAVGTASFLFLTVLILSMSGYAPGDYEVSGGIIPVDPKARGTKLNCTLTIAYTLASESACETGAGAAESFFMRIRKGNNLYQYGGKFPTGPCPVGFARVECGPGKPCPQLCPQECPYICWDYIADQVEFIVGFFGEVAMPELFPDTPNAPFAIKSYGNNVQGGAVTGAPFAMLDLVIAVQE